MTFQMQKNRAASAAMAASGRDAGLTVNTNVRKPRWEEMHSAPGGGNVNYGFQQHCAPSSRGMTRAIWHQEDATVSQRRHNSQAPRGSREAAGRVVKAQNIARVQNQMVSMLASENGSSQDLVYTREQLVEIRENTAALAHTHSHLNDIVKIDSVGEIKDLGTGNEGHMLLSVTTLTPEEIHHIASTDHGTRMPLGELHLAMHCANQQRSDDYHNLVAERKHTHPLRETLSMSPVFSSPGASHRRHMLEKVGAARRAAGRGLGIGVIGDGRRNSNISSEDSNQLSPRRNADARFESLLARLRPFADGATNSSSGYSEFGIQHGIYPPRAKKEKEQDKAKTFNPNATEFIPVQQDASAAVGVGFAAKPMPFIRKAVNDLFSPEMTPAAPGAPIMSHAQLLNPIPAIPIEMMDPAIISCSPAPASIPLGMPPPPGFGGFGAAGIRIPEILTFTGVPEAPIAPPIVLPPGLGFGYSPLPFPVPALHQPRAPQYAAPGPRPVRKPRVPDAMAQMNYEQYLEERRARDPHGYAMDCKRRQAARWQRQRLPGPQPGGAWNAPSGGDVNVTKKQKSANSTSSTNTASTQTGTDESTGTIDRKNADVSTASEQTKDSSESVRSESRSKDGSEAASGTKGLKTPKKEKRNAGAGSARSPLKRTQGRAAVCNLKSRGD